MMNKEQADFEKEQYEFYIAQGYSSVEASKLARQDFWRAVEDGHIK